MSVLVDWEIEDLITNGELIIDPVDLSLINPASLDIRLSRYFSKLVCNNGLIDLLDKSSYQYEPVESDKIVIKSGESLLASTIEVISLPSNISSRLIGKSSGARVFLDNSSFGAWIDPGFSATIVLELVNHSQYDIMLYEGMRIGQLVFYKHSESETPYNKRKSSKYMNQKPAQGSLYWKNGK